MSEQEQAHGPRDHHPGPKHLNVKTHIESWLTEHGRHPERLTSLFIQEQTPGLWLVHIGGGGPTIHARVHRTGDRLSVEETTPQPQECGHWYCHQNT
jgi:hypothetical protein